MNIQKIHSAQSFGHVTIANKEYEKILKPFEKELDEITKGYDVYISQDHAIYAYNEHLDENIQLFGLPGITINPYNSANRTIPEMKFIIHPGAGEMQTEEAQAEEMIRIIKKGISLYR